MVNAVKPETKQRFLSTESSKKAKQFKQDN